MKNRLVLGGFLIFLAVGSFLGLWHNTAMWQRALKSSRDDSIALGAFVEASEWLSQNLKPGDIALVPSPEVFEVSNPELRGRLVDYKSIWNSVGFQLRDRGDSRKLQTLRSSFVGFLDRNWAVKYVVRDWGEPYATSLFGAAVDDDLMLHLNEVKIVPFKLSTGWSSKITIYEVVRYTTLFSIGFSSPPRQYSTIPSDASVWFDSDGMTIEKVGSRVGFYLPLEAGINASRQNYLSMAIKFYVEDLSLLLAFYFDKNRDGKFSGYGVDYAESVSFDQRKQNWVKGEWYTIYQGLPIADDPIVQIGTVASGEKDGTFSISDITVRTEMTPEDVVVEASNWLSENLRDGEFALIPDPVLLTHTNPELNPKLIDYSSLWISAGVTLGANCTEVLKVRKYLLDFLEGNASVKYLVRDWTNPYAERIFEATTSDELEFLLREEKAVFFTLGIGWSRTMRIYEVVRYTTLFSIGFSSPPRQYSTVPSDASVWFDSDGMTIEKVGSRVGFYLPLEAGINALRQNYLSMAIKFYVEDLSLLLAFYFDKDRDGKWGGYNSTDYVNSVVFNQTKLGWIKGEEYTIYQGLPIADDPIVQIGIVMTGDVDGTVTLKDLTVYAQTAS